MNTEPTNTGSAVTIPAGEVCREQVLAAGYALLAGLHDLTFHQGDGESLEFEAHEYGLAYVVENLRGVAERARGLAEAAIEALHQVDAAHAWLVSQHPKRCANCGDPIDVTEVEGWWICRSQPEHRWCHLPYGTEQGEDHERASVIVEDEWAAYCEDRERAGGPWHGDQVELVFPDGRSVHGTWYIPGPAPLGAPLVLDWQDTETNPVGAQVSVTGLGEDYDLTWVPSLEDLTRGAELAAALARPVPHQDDCGDLDPTAAQTATAAGREECAMDAGVEVFER